MPSRFITIPAVLACVLMAIAVSGCNSQVRVHSTLSTTAAGRQIKASIDAPASIQSDGDAATVSFGSHKVRVEKERLLLDGTERGKFLADVTQIQIVMTNQTLIVMAEGTNILNATISP